MKTTIHLKIESENLFKAALRIARDEDGLAPVEKAGEADVVLCEVNGGTESLTRALDTMARTRGEVFLVGESPSPDLLIQAMRAGIQEYLPAPLGRDELLSAVGRLKGRAESARESGRTRGRIITVLGAQGGVGATTMAVNLAWEMNRARPGSTALADLCRPSGEAPLFLDLDYTYTWADVMESIERLDAVYLDSVMARHHSGLAVLPAPELTYGMDGLDEFSMEKLLTEMAKCYPVVVADAQAWLDDLSFKLVTLSDTVLLSAVMSLPCLARVKRFFESLRTFDPEAESRVRLVINRQVGNSMIEPGEAEEILRHKISWIVPDDYPAALAAVNQGKLLSETAAKSPAARALQSMAHELAGPRSGEKAGGASRGGLSLLGGLFKKASKEPEAELSLQP